MFFADFILTLVIALMLTTVFVLGWGRTDSGAVWPALLYFLVLVWFGTWAFGIWMHPVGPLMWGAPVLTFLAVGVVLALLLGAAFPARTRRTHVGGPPPALDDEADAAAALGFGVFFWIFVLVALLVLLGRYATL